MTCTGLRPAATRCRKLVWRTILPARTELFDLAKDPSERQDLSAQEPAKAAALQRRVLELAQQMAPSPLLSAEFAEIRRRLASPPAFPEDATLSGGADERVFEDER